MLDSSQPGFDWKTVREVRRGGPAEADQEITQNLYLHHPPHILEAHSYRTRTASQVGRVFEWVLALALLMKVCGGSESVYHEYIYFFTLERKIPHVSNNDRAADAINERKRRTELNAIPVDDDCPGSNGIGQNSDGNGFRSSIDWKRDTRCK